MNNSSTQPSSSERAYSPRVAWIWAPLCLLAWCTVMSTPARPVSTFRETMSIDSTNSLEMEARLLAQKDEKNAQLEQRRQARLKDDKLAQLEQRMQQMESKQQQDMKVKDEEASTKFNEIKAQLAQKEAKMAQLEQRMQQMASKQQQDMKAKDDEAATKSNEIKAHLQQKDDKIAQLEQHMQQMESKQHQSGPLRASLSARPNSSSTASPGEPASSPKLTPAKSMPAPHNPDVFDPKLTIADYEALPNHSRPSKAWLTSCVWSLGNDTDINQPFQTPRPGYRLGDCIKLCKECHKGKNKDSMAISYGRLACQGPDNQPQNFSVVDQIFRDFETGEGFKKPDPDTLVVHLRLGDVVVNTFKRAEELLIEGGIGAHPDTQRLKIQTIRSVYNYLDIFQGINRTKSFPKVQLVGGSHHPMEAMLPQRQKIYGYMTSKVYAHCLQRGLAKAGIKTNMWIEGRDPDQDFYYMSNAKHLMLSTGGFSRMIGKMVKRRGGELVDELPCGPCT